MRHIPENYFLNPKRGIYRTEKAYHDDVDYIYVVDFESPDCGKQFRDFIERIEADGAHKKLIQIRQDFKGLMALLGD